MNGGLYGLTPGERGHRSIELPHLDLESSIAAPSENFIINPSMGIMQRGAAALSPIANGGYGPDRWKAYYPSGTLTYVQETLQAIDIFHGASARRRSITPFNCLRHQKFAAFTVGASNPALYQPIESHASAALLGQIVVMQCLVYGTGRLQFGLLESTGTIDAPGVPFSATAPLTLAAGFVPCQLLRTWNCSPCNAGAAGALDSLWTWHAAAFRVRRYSAANTLINNLIPYIGLSAGAQIGEINLLPGSVPRIWTPRAVGDELQLCQRFYEKSYNQDVTPGATSALGAQASFAYTAGNLCDGNIRFQVEKRAIPTVTTYSTTGASGQIRDISGAADIASSQTRVGTNGAFISGTAMTVGNFHDFQWTAVAEIN